jgi:hypothetical protein
LQARRDMRRLIATLLLIMRSLSSGAMCSAGSPTSEASLAAIATMGGRTPPKTQRRLAAANLHSLRSISWAVPEAPQASMVLFLTAPDDGVDASDDIEAGHNTDGYPYSSDPSIHLFRSIHSA